MTGICEDRAIVIMGTLCYEGHCKNWAIVNIVLLRTLHWQGHCGTGNVVSFREIYYVTGNIV